MQEAVKICANEAKTGEYVLIPLLLRCIQIADQLAVSAVVRGIQCPVKRSSYYGKKMRTFDYIAVIVWSTTTAAVIMVRSLA